MSGFDIEHNEQVIENTIRERFVKARTEVLEVLNSPGYEEIVESVEIAPDFSEIAIELKDDIKVDGQNIVQVFAKGGQIKKGDEFIDVMPNPIIRKYLGTG